MEVNSDPATGEEEFNKTVEEILRKTEEMEERIATLLKKPNKRNA